MRAEEESRLPPNTHRLGGRGGEEASLSQEIYLSVCSRVLFRQTGSEKLPVISQDTAEG